MVKKSDQYKKQLIYHLYFGKALSCAALSKLTGKSISFITKFIQLLLKNEIIIEHGHAVSTGGRRPLLYSLQPDIMFTVALACDQFVTRIAIVNMNQQVVGEEVIIPLDLKESENALPLFADEINQLVAKSAIDKKNILGIGVSMPGFINGQAGVNYSYAQNQNIVQQLEHLTHLRTFLDNDSSVIALAEQKFGNVNDKNALVINIGWGVGLGIILDNKLYRGDSGMAGEFSHFPLFSNNKICSCGKMGCLETEASVKAIIDKARMHLPSRKTKSMITIEMLDNYIDAIKNWINAVIQGDSFAIAQVSEAGYYIGKGLAVLIHILNPKKIILSGRGSSIGQIMLPPIQLALNEQCIPQMAKDIEISISNLNDQAQIIGSAALVVYKNI